MTTDVYGIIVAKQYIKVTAKQRQDLTANRVPYLDVDSSPAIATLQDPCLQETRAFFCSPTFNSDAWLAFFFAAALPQQ